MFYEWLVYLHVLSAILFVAAHGVSMAVSFRIKSAGSRADAIAVLGVSETSLVSMYITLGLLVVTGITLGVLGDFWREGWFWASLLVLVAITAAMVPLGAIAFSNIRRFAGTEYAVKGKRFPAEPPDETKMMAAIGAVRPDLLTIIGLGGLALVLWMMIFKPF